MQRVWRERHFSVRVWKVKRMCECVCVCVCVFSEEQSCKFRLGAQGRPRWSDILVKSGKVWRREPWRSGGRAPEETDKCPILRKGLAGGAPEILKQEYLSSGPRAGDKGSKGMGCQGTWRPLWVLGLHKYCAVVYKLRLLSVPSTWRGKKRGGGREGGRKEGKRELKNTMPSLIFTRAERIKVSQVMCVVCCFPLCS